MTMNAKRLSREQVAWRVAQDLPDGATVNLGIGMPEMVANFVPSDREVLFHTENGLLGMGPAPAQGCEDPDLINAGKKPATMLKGASLFHHADSFAMIRGGHIDFCVIGAFQISAAGDLANWSTNETGAIPAVGGAMDLAVGAKNLFVMTEHCTKSGSPKLVRQCSYPLTGLRVVKRVYTDLAVIEIGPDGMAVLESLPEYTRETMQALTDAPLHWPQSWKPLDVPTFASKPPSAAMRADAMRAAAS